MLSDVIAAAGDLPLHTAILGVYPDRGHPPTFISPYCIDLTDPKAGSLLVVGDPRQAAQLVQTMWLSAQAIPPGKVERVLISPDAISAYSRTAQSEIMRLAAVAEQRRSGRELGSPVILAIPDLADLGWRLEYGVFVHLKWLLTHGPYSWVWTVAGVERERAYKVDRRLLERFGTLVRGCGEGIYQVDTGEWFVSPEVGG
jgi:hypothetical protein